MTNNFSSYKAQFTADTGLDWKTNVDAYIQYVQARILDEMKQQQLAKADELVAAIKAIKLVP